MKSIKKTILSCVTSVLGTTSIVAPMSCMTSCANNGRKVDDTDQQYDISSTTYDSMRRELDNLYYLKLKDRAYPEEIIEEKMAEMKEDLSSLDQQAADLAATSTLEDAQEKGVDFTALTQALSEQSYKKYEIRLSRSSSAKWSNFLTYFNSLYDSSYIYMRNLQMHESAIQQRLQKAKDSFNALFESLRDEYFYDPLLGITIGMPKLIQCFEECNLEIALVSANDRLTDFLNKYNFVMKPDEPQARYDKLLERGFVRGSVIKDETMQLIFDCVDRETGTKIPFYGSGPQAILPGYVLTPHFYDFREDNYNNTFGMLIDWSIYPSTYEDSEYKDLVTSHVYGDNKDIREGKCDEGEEFAFNKAFQKSEVMTTEYSLLPTAEYEAQRLLWRYFQGGDDGKKITFSWYDNAEDPRNKFECFYDGIPLNKSKGLLNQESLADSGLRISDDGINFKPFRELINWVKENNEAEEPVPDGKLTLSQKFVKYVIAESNVEIVNADRHFVNNKFQYHYLTSQNGDDAIAIEPEIRRANGFLVSESFFDKANNVFADTADVILRDYQRKRYTEVLVSCHSLESTFISTTAMTAVQIVKNVVKMIFAGFATKLICALCIAMIGLNAVFLGIGWALYDDFLIKPIEEFCERVEKIRRHPSIYPLQWKFECDKEDWFCMRDDSGQFDQREYQTKKGDFVKANFVDSRNKFQYYTTFPYQEEPKEFYDVCMENECDPYTFYKTFDSWQYSAKCYLIIYGYSGIRMGINSVIMAWEEWTWTSLMIEMGLEFILGTMITKFCEKEIYHIDPNRTVPQ